ncbi:MAG TPA: metallophosphoesterase family protein [Phycisphaerae bacterium]|nr:metallophosphoesterase family protein [Phycisphaerae bacterium]HRY68487.1 metallophosphoesterase family protein [Phycisphaerae bacterium]HSA29518.1 metallophosphoesterase family protein [Phycisphaerae bacterium]
MICLNPSLRALGVVLACTLVAKAAETNQPTTSPALRILGGPYLQAPSPTSMTVVWTTNKPCVSRLQFGPSANEMPNVATSAHHGLIDASTTLHRITVSGLSPGTTRHYCAVSTEIVEFNPYKVKYGPSVRTEGQFTTLDPKKETFSFCVLNDRHDKAPKLRQDLGAVKWEGVDLVFALGDVMNDPKNEPQIFQNFINPCVEFFAGRIPLVFVRGNHETRGALARNLIDYFPTESGRYYYSFDHGSIHFLLLDGGEDKGDDSPEYSGLAAFEDYLKQETEWLDQELQSPAFLNARFRVCLLHIPPVADTKDTKFIRAPWLRDNWSPRLSKAGIDLMLCGHTHVYAELPPDVSRAYPIVVGGTDTVIRVDVSPERLLMTTFKDNGAVLSRPPEVRAKR